MPSLQITAASLIASSNRPQFYLDITVKIFQLICVRLTTHYKNAYLSYNTAHIYPCGHGSKIIPCRFPYSLQNSIVKIILGHQLIDFLAITLAILIPS